MSEQSIDPMAEIQEIIDNVLNMSSATKDDCAEAHAKFQMTFLTLSNKDDFITFLHSYLEEMLEKFGPDDEKYVALKMEIDRFYDNIPSIFSIYRIAGLKDPQDKNESEVGSKDIDDDFDDIMKLRRVNNKDDFYIPEEKKPVVTRVLQNISIFGDQIKATRIQTLTKWRFLRLAKKNADLLRVFPACMTIAKFVNRKYKLFYQLKNAVNSIEKNGETNHVSISNISSIVEVENSNTKEISGPNGIVKTDKNRRTKNDSSTTPSGYLNDQNDLNEKLKAKDKVISDLRIEIKKLTDAKTQSSQGSLGTTSLDEQIKKFKSDIAELETRIIELNRDNEAKKNLMNEHIAELLEQKNTIEKLSNELKQLRRADGKANLNNFGKIRFFIKIINNLSQKQAQNAFNKLLKRSVKTSNAIHDVSLRMKARLLEQTRNLNCGKDMHRNFLKWFVRSDNTLIRDLMTKVLVNSRVSAEIAIYRMKKMIHKPSRNKLSDTVKLLHRSKAAMLLHDIFSRKGTQAKKNFFESINPNHKTSKEAMIEKVLVGVPKTHMKNTKKKVIDRLRKILRTEKKILAGIANFWKIKSRVALKQLQLNNKNAKQLERFSQFGKGLDKLQKMLNKRTRPFVDKLKDMCGKSAGSKLDRLVAASKFKMLATLSTLKTNNNHAKMERTTQSYQTNMNDLKKKNVAQMLISSLRKKMFFSLNVMRLFCEDERKASERRQLLGQRVLASMAERLKHVKAQALKRLKNNRRMEANREQKKKITMGLFMNCVRQKMMICLAKLTENYSKLKSKQNRINRLLLKILKKLETRSKIKMQKTFKKLKQNKQTEKLKESKALNRLFSKLPVLKNEFLKNVYNKLKENSHVVHSQNLLNHKKNTALKRLINLHKMPMLRVLRDLKIFNQNEKVKAQLKNDKIRNLLKKLADMSSKKTHFALNQLNDTLARRKSAEEQRKKKLKDLMNLLKEKSKAKMNKVFGHLKQLNNYKKTQQQRENEITRKLLMNVLAKNDQRKKLALLKLANNNRRIKETNESKNRNIAKLLNQLKNASNGKRNTAFLNLRKRAQDLKNLETSKTQKISNLLDRLHKSASANERTVFAKLKENSNFERENANDNENKKAFFIEKLLNSNLKRHPVFNKIVSVARALRKSQNDKDTKLKAILQKLLRANHCKMEKALITLFVIQQKDRHNKQISRITGKYKDALNHRKQRGLLMLLVSSQIGKMQTVMSNLIKFANQKKLDDIKSRNRNQYRLQKLMDNIHNKTRDVFERLKKNKNEQIDAERNKQTKEEKVGNVFGAPPKDHEATQFSDLANQFKKINQKSNDYTLKRLCDWMKRKNKRGIYDPVLGEIDAGKLNNLKEVLGYAENNNKIGELDALIYRINDTNREAHDVLTRMKNQNADGKFNEMIDHLEKNPKITKSEIIELISGNKTNAVYPDLKVVVDEEKKIDDLMKYMKKNNKDGKFEKALAYLRQLRDPKLSDLMHFINTDKHGNYDNLIKEVNKEDAVLTPRQLLNVAKVLNANGQFDELLGFAEKERIPTLTDLTRFMKSNNKDGKHNGLIDMVNDKKSNEIVKNLKDDLISNNPNGENNKLIEYLKRNPNTTLTNVFDFVTKNNPDGKLNKVLENLNAKNRVEKYCNFIKNNNKDGNFREILSSLGPVEKAKFTNLVTDFMVSPNDERYKSIIEKINTEEPINDVKNLINEKCSDPNIKNVGRFLQVPANNKMINLIEFVTKNNKNGELQSVVDLINQKNKPDLNSKIMETITRQSSSGKNEQVLAEVANIGNPKTSELISILLKNNNDGKFNGLLRDINGQPKEVTEQFIECLEKQNKDDKLEDVIAKIKKLRTPKLTELLKLVEDENKKNTEHETDPTEVLGKIIDWMQKNNDDGVYNEPMDYLFSLENPKLTDLIDFINDNNDGRFDNILDKIDNDVDRRKIKNFVFKNVDDFPDLVTFWDTDPDLKIGDVVQFIREYNADSVYDKILDKINGNESPRTLSGILDYLQKNNIGGVYSELIEKLKAYDDPSVGEAIQEIKSGNKDNKFDEVLNFINRKNYGTITQAVKLMKNNNRGNRFSKILAVIDERPEYSLGELMDEVERDNSDGKLEDLQTVLNNEDKRNLRDEVLDFIAKNNKNGKFNNFQNDIDNGKANELTSLMHLIKSTNTQGKYNDLLNIIDEAPKDALVKDVIDYAREHNKDGKYNPFLDSIKRLKNPKLTDLIEFISKNNETGKYDPMFEMVNGNNYSTSKVHNFLSKHNKDGRYNELLEFVQNNPNANLSKVVNEANKRNPKGEMNGLLNFLSNGCNDPDISDDGTDDLFKFLANARKNKLYPELMKHIEDGNIKNVKELYDFLINNNRNGFYDDLINKLKEHMEKKTDSAMNADEKSPKLIQAAKAKMLACLKKFRAFNYEKSLIEKLKNMKLNNLFQNLKSKSDKKTAEALQKFEKNKNDKNEIGKLKNRKLNSLFKNLENAKNKNLSEVLSKLLKNKNSENAKKYKQLVAQKWFLSRLQNACKQKKIKAFNTLFNKKQKLAKAMGDLMTKIKSANDVKLRKTLLNFSDAINQQKQLKQAKLDFFNDLVAKQQRKLAECVKKLQKNKFEGQMKNKMKQTAQNLLIKKLANNLKMNEQNALNKLREFAKNSNHKNELGKTKAGNVIKQLQKYAAIKARQTLQKLIQNKNDIKNREIEKHKNTNYGLKKFGNSLKEKMSECLQKLRQNMNDRKSKDLQTQTLSKLLFNRINAANSRKLGSTLTEMKVNNQQQQADQNYKDAKTRVIFNKLRDAKKGLLKSVYDILKSNKQKLNDAQNKKDKQKLGLNFFENQIKKNRTNDLQKILQKLRENNQQLKNNNDKKSHALANLFSKSRKVGSQNLSNAMKKLLDNKNKIVNQENHKKNMAQKLLKKLKEAAEEKQRKCLSNLQNLNNREKMTGNVLKINKKRAIEKLINSCKAKMIQSMHKLSKNNKDTKNKEEQLRNKKLVLFQKWADNLQQLKARVFGNIRKRVQQEKLNEKNRNQTLSKLFTKLVEKSKKKQQNVIQDFHKLAFSRKSKEQLKNALLKNVFGKLMKAKLANCLEKLMLFTLRQKIRAVKKEAALRQNKASSLCKSALVIGKLKGFSAVQKLKFRHNAAILNSVLGGLIKGKKSAVLHSLCQNSLKLGASKDAAVRFIRKQLLNKERNAYEKLRHVNNVYKRNQINNSLSSMMFCLKKNHKASMRQLLDVWSRKELKKKTNKITNTLQALLNKRLAAGLERIKYEYNLWKYRNVVKGLMSTVDKVNKIQGKFKQKALRDMYDMFIDSNPWFKKCISILTMSTKLTDQVSFWRMRHVKNLKREGVNPMQAIKLKNLAQIIKKQETKILNYAIWNLTQIHDMSMSRLSNLGMTNSSIIGRSSRL